MIVEPSVVLARVGGVSMLSFRVFLLEAGKDGATRNARHGTPSFPPGEGVLYNNPAWYYITGFGRQGFPSCVFRVVDGGVGRLSRRGGGRMGRGGVARNAWHGALFGPGRCGCSSGC